jgi:hypothetical protein
VCLSGVALKSVSQFNGHGKVSMNIWTDTERGAPGGREAIREYVDAVGDADPEINAIIERGAWRDTSPPADDVEAIGELAEAVGRTPRRCYRNAREVAGAAGRDDVRYVEGIAVPATVPVATKHAWVEVDGSVIEVTWEDTPVPGEGSAYYGVAIELDTVLETVNDRGTDGPVITEVDR